MQDAQLIIAGNIGKCSKCSAYFVVDERAWKISHTAVERLQEQFALHVKLVHHPLEIKVKKAQPD
jgi:hypothetical protein